MRAAGDFLRTAAPLVSLVAALLVATRRQVIRDFERQGAADASTAVLVSPSSPFKKWWLHRLGKAGVLKSSGDGRRWLDRTEWNRYRTIRKRRALVVLAVLLLVMAVLFGSGM